MGRFVDVAALDEIKLGEDRVFVRQRLTAPESAALKRDLVRFKMNADTGQVEVDEVAWHLSKINVVKAYAVRWEGPGFLDPEDTAVPCTAEHIERLGEETIEELAQAIDGLQRARREQQAKKGGG